MRIALISDIHGHEIALEMVLAEIDNEAVDLTICLGDVAPLGPRPRECLDILRSREIPCVMGNHDEFLLLPDLIRQYPTAPPVLAAVDWCRSELNDDHFAYLRGFQYRLAVPADYGGGLGLFHGSPRSHMEMILATTPAEELDEMLDGLRGGVLAGGHTHVQMLRQHKGQLVLNVGSVGMPFGEHSRIAAARNEAPSILPHAEYSIVQVRQGRVQADLRRVDLDSKRTRASVMQSHMPMREMFAAQYL